MLFMAATASVLGEKSQDTKRSHKMADGHHRKNVSVLSYHNILKDIKEESPQNGFRSNLVSNRDSLLNIQPSGQINPFQSSEMVLPQANNSLNEADQGDNNNTTRDSPRRDSPFRGSPGLSIQQESMKNIRQSINHQHSTSSLNSRIDYRNMKILSIKEFDQLKNKEEDDHKK